jgi:hypothetical protein
MKKLALFLVLILVSSAPAFTAGRNRAVRPEGSIRHSPYSAPQDKREVTDNDVQVRLEITGSDEDGWDIDAVNPTSGEKRECAVTFTLTGTDKKDEEKSIEISREKKITVSSTATGWFNADGEAGLPGRRLKISSFNVSCR